MNENILEHVNITVASPQDSAALMCRIFDWQIRWQGPSEMAPDAYTVHVGSSSSYIAFYTQDGATAGNNSSYERLAAINHIAVLVDDLDAIEHRLVEEGLQPHSHADYAPGRRFYFETPDGLEVEVVSYQPS